MSTRFKNSIEFASIVLAVAWFYTTAFAYVLHGQHILELMTEKMGQAESLFISQKVFFYRTEIPSSTSEAEKESNADTRDPESAGGVEDLSAGGGEGATSEMLGEKDLAPDEVEPEIRVMDESLRYLISEAFRSDIVTDDNRRIHILQNGKTLTIIGDVARTASQTRFDLYKDILLFRSRPELVDRLTRLSVDVSVSSLGRFEDRIAYVIGAQYPDESVDQLWVDKATFRPLRWIIASGASGFQTSPLEIRYYDWWQLNDIFWYPMRIEFYQNSQLVREIKVQRYEVDASFSQELFDIEQLRATYPQAAETFSDSGETENVSEVQRTIEEFNKMFE